MAYYYVVPFYLTAVFLVAYQVVSLMLRVFDFLNFFWDWWDTLRQRYPPVVLAEYAILIGFFYYIVKWELSGTP
ncbi:MAG: hypothetical protein OZSIB_0159 [Candidatus Ozemobacter sibiricus]|jgi:hypothetical protein|uniref:Uncharacterized protein n=1 Tax=Candidatus Ozemobacter sibiricus TaxID=2268124 RepID=A0A367ZMD5_9BACT|nr:MAG: hypothetical protein OZSIB_0159 [Candidatus Ozemobacter sibiricus]